MLNLLHQISTQPIQNKIIWIILFILTAISMLSIIINLEESKGFKSIITHFLIFIAFATIFGKISNYLDNKINLAIVNKEYTLNVNGGVLELTSQSPYLESKQFKIIYQDDKRIQVEYNDDYFEIDKSQEKINDANWPSSES